MLRCQICGDISTPSFSGDASHLQPIVTADHVSWCIDYASFRAGCDYVSLGSYRTAYGLSSLVTVSGGSWLNFGSVSRTFDVSLVSPEDGSGGAGRIGSQTVSYERLFYGSDGSTQSEAGPTTTTWRFADASFALCLAFSADSSGSGGVSIIDVSAESASLVRVVKPHNDAACDYVSSAVGLSGPSLPLDLTSSSSDSVTHEFDYASWLLESPFADGLPVSLPSAPTLQIDDAVFSAAVEANRTLDVSDAFSLHLALDEMVEGGRLCGLRSQWDVSLSIATSVAGESRSPTVVLLTPQLFFHS